MIGLNRECDAKAISSLDTRRGQLLRFFDIILGIGVLQKGFMQLVLELYAEGSDCST